MVSKQHQNIKKYVKLLPFVGKKKLTKQQKKIMKMQVLLEVLGLIEMLVLVEETLEQEMPKTSPLWILELQVKHLHH